ncbi:MAG: 4'-phosphopantetheinyl transferase superfamily protein [Bacteroidales bacterium]|nr:4'-phosphopantetheinyl transferase superfamily protein [Bacteroidales bacterium]
MIHVLYIKYSDPLSPARWNKLISQLPDNLKDKNARFVNWKDKHSNLFGKLLIDFGLKNIVHVNYTLADLKYNKYGRPFVDGFVDFNISHSGEYVICAISDNCKVGIDIQYIMEIEFLHFKNTMNDEQWKAIYNSIDPYKTFFTFWSTKESIIKADGRGLSIPLKELSVDKKVRCDNKEWYVKKLEIARNYTSYLTTNNNNSQITVTKIETALL